MRYCLLLVLWCWATIGWAADFSRQEIGIMHNAGIRMALVGEKPYVIPADISPDRLLGTELLDFSGRSLVVVPDWLGRFTQLRKLDLSNTDIHADASLLGVLASMGQLEVLNLSGNPLFSSGGSLAGVWDKLPGLRELNLSNTGGQATHYGSMAVLRRLLRLDMSQNSLGDLGVLGLADLPLQQVSFAKASLRGDPLDALPGSTLEQLDLSGNDSIRFGEQHGSLFALPKLAQLKVDSNIARPKGMQQRLEQLKQKEQEDLNKQHASRYTVNANGTVSDSITGLMWKRCAEGQAGNDCTGDADKYTWDAAMSQFGKDVNFAGYNDWRMPTREELRTLVWCSNGIPQEEAWDNYCSGKDGRGGEYQSPTINVSAFPNTPAYAFWSSTAHENASDAWDVYFGFGFDGWYSRDNDAHVRLVRSGQ